MRIVEGFCLREVLGEKIVVPTGAAAAKLSGIAALNETGEFLFQLLQTEQTEETLLAAMLAEYDVEPLVAAVLVENLSDEYLEYASLTFEIEGKQAVFEVTGLTAGDAAWVLGYNVDSPNENTLIRLQTANGSDSQRWIIEYAGGEDGDGNAANGNELHYYNIRNVGCGRMLRINNQHAKFGYATGNKYDNTVYWRMVYNDADDTYMLHSWDVLKNKSPNSGYAYMTPVTGANSGVKSETEGAPLQGH